MFSEIGRSEREMKYILPILAAAAALTGGAEIASAQTASTNDRISRVIVFGNDPCPRGANGEVVVFMRLHARAAGSESVIEQRVAAVWSLRDERAVRVRYYDDRDEALKAAGLSE